MGISQTRMWPRGRRRLAVASVALLMLVMSAPAGADVTEPVPDAPVVTADAESTVRLASTFPDVPAGSTHATGIAAVSQAGITSGCGGGLFCPKDEVTRDQMATFLYRALELPAGSVAGFSDVLATGTHAAGIGAVAQAGITAGCGGGRFCPSEPVTREQMATFLYRALDLPAGSVAGFSDVLATGTHAVGIGAVAQADITAGCGGGRFCPSEPVTREQMATFLYRALDLDVEVEGYPELTAHTLSTGRSHTCAIQDGGQVWCWGDNRQAQAGIDVGFPAVPSPHRIDAVSDAVDVSAHSTISCAVRRTGGVACWGNNQFGLLGGGFDSPGGRVIPVEVVGISDAVAVRGDAYGGPAVLSCVQHANGGASCWGINANYGDGIHYPDREDQGPLTPVRSQLRDALEISVGNGHVCGRHTDGGVSCWGSNSSGQSGDGNLTLPGRLSGIGDVIEIEAGGGTTCARTGDAAVSCWGNNAYGQVGNGVTSSPVTTPYRVSALTGAQQVSIGFQHACALLPDGAVSCWGANERGQLGDGTDVARATPTRVLGITNAVEVSAGAWHSCARLADGRVLCWGDNDHGQLGDTSRLSSLTPVEVFLVNLGRR